MIGSIWELARGGSIWELRHVAPKLREQLVSVAPPRWAGRERSPRALQRGVGRLLQSHSAEERGAVRAGVARRRAFSVGFSAVMWSLGCRHDDLSLEVGDQVVVVVSMRSGQRCIKRCEAASTAAGTSTILAK